jgi:hypothetical protein
MDGSHVGTHHASSLAPHPFTTLLIPFNDAFNT